MFASSSSTTIRGGLSTTPHRKRLHALTVFAALTVCLLAFSEHRRRTRASKGWSWTSRRRLFPALKLA